MATLEERAKLAEAALVKRAATGEDRKHGWLRGFVLLLVSTSLSVIAAVVVTQLVG